MRVSRLVLQLDIILAVLVLAGSVFISVRGFGRINQEETRGSLFQGPIGLGETKVRIIRGSECIGGINTSLQEEAGNLIWRLSGSLRTLVSGRVVYNKLRAESGFNILGQMGIGFFELDAPSGRLRITSNGIDPVNLLVKLTRSPADFERSFVIPGPFELRPIGSRRYRFEYAHLSGSRKGGLGLAGDLLKDRLRLRAEVVPELPQDCQAEVGPSLNLEGFVSEMGGLLSKLSLGPVLGGLPP
jgi:hypothetical protein